ncbi:molybdopterin-guanine dinucleotide biosynthesis protein B [Massilia sp. Leaf139]|uniref:molybdopterin-guanine dinucleotide biosynthesis protein B n=1 Tax=Massilia sp. Leaf139 TaxID=1736272 RepID=UPI0006F2032C|nr:molybdopterin-guanine dinucleotide biosynthesis protein B [Massilia sp. Leaf139]KQQ86799.1 molybdopterin-guanine dinucleotide biosynthesis protein MobB [Massilia sp. Leaf139]
MSVIDPAPAPAVLAVVGWSGSGKTTLLEFLVAQLAARGLRVNVVKHSHHDIELEPPHKDSARLRMAGAAEVMIASPYRYAILRELRGMEEPPLAEQLARLAPADLTLVEGYKWEPLPKLEVFRPALGRAPLYPHDPLVVAVASDAAAPDGVAAAWLDLNRPQDVLGWLSEWMLANPKVSEKQADNRG